MLCTHRSMSNGFSTLKAPVWLAAALLLGVGCGSEEPTDTADTGVGEIESIAPTYFRYLQGHFDSADQAATNGAYYAIELRMCEVDAPELGAMAIYVEQALAGDEPYRQRIYVIEDGDQPDVEARSVMYELTYPVPWTGFCDGESTSTGVVTSDYVSPLVGCDVTVAWDGETFSGGTFEDACLNDWGGATYATSEVTLSAARLDSWDQGWDADGNYVWGATAGPYQFVRRTELVER
jgi:CpeT protein